MTPSNNSQLLRLVDTDAGIAATPSLTRFLGQFPANDGRNMTAKQCLDGFFLFGQDTDVDSYGGYAGNIAWMDWKFLGEKEILGAIHAEHFPVKWGEKSGDFTAVDRNTGAKLWAKHVGPRVDLAVCLDPRTGEAYSRFYKIPETTEDLLKRRELIAAGSRPTSAQAFSSSASLGR